MSPVSILFLFCVLKSSFFVDVSIWSFYLFYDCLGTHFTCPVIYLSESFDHLYYFGMKWIRRDEDLSSFHFDYSFEETISFVIVLKLFLFPSSESPVDDLTEGFYKVQSVYLHPSFENLFLVLEVFF